MLIKVCMSLEYDQAKTTYDTPRLHTRLHMSMLSNIESDKTKYNWEQK